MSQSQTQASLEPEIIRLAVERQPTVGQSVVALLRGVAYLCQHGKAEDFAKAFDANPKGWSDAVMANTPDAVETATLIAPVPAEAQAAMAPPAHGAHAEQHARR